MQHWSKILEYLRKHQNTKRWLFLFPKQWIPILIPSPTYYRSTFQKCMTCTVSYWHVQSKSLFWELHKGAFWGLSVWWDNSKARLWLGFFCPLGIRVHAHWEYTTDHIILTTVVNRYLKWTDSRAHKLPASLAGWRTWKSKQYATWTPLQVLCDTELKFCSACQEC